MITRGEVVCVRTSRVCEKTFILFSHIISFWRGKCIFRSVGAMFVCVVSAPHEWLLNTTLISPQQLEKNQPMLNDASLGLLPQGCVFVCACVCVCVCVRSHRWHVDRQPRSDCRSATICGCIYVCLHWAACVSLLVCVCVWGGGCSDVGWGCTQSFSRLDHSSIVLLPLTKVG